ncbi:methyltransferase domain-containing protein [Acaryochloris sp. 'Moss Beach']|uniref:class I SAM-dependent methyltransferase n=1 Tax=Acaryochloris sp. 'Moss Beach' TaxID=2740837 RepID=UPI001F394360|nr:class I SAM-dependent methyltransferase [Acaryochloris sp. 'Moss Beach']UJB69146.1 methyltransferase domain-containing protein [Acaryochloris sp. 'Moss Beach']
MQALPNPFDLPVAEPIAKLAYETMQRGKNAFGAVHRQVLGNLKSTLYPGLGKVDSLDDETLAYLQHRQADLMEKDWQDAQLGVYPISLLFDNPWEEFFRLYPQVWLDAPHTWARADQKNYQDFSPGIDVDSYPQYYIQNFHHQTDGYLSETSAEIYDLQVELLFGGTADAMRRRILAPLKKGLATFSAIPASRIRILDVPSGAGRTLKQLRGTFSEAALSGVDLSRTYLQKTNRLLSQDRGSLPQLLQANAESLPYVDNYFHGVSSVFLFHELPAPARQNVMNECFRVLQPGGTFVICDSIQLDDSPELKTAIDGFPAMMHEPYYRHYSTDNIVERLQNAGFVDIETDVHFMSKYFTARKPA